MTKPLTARQNAALDRIIRQGNTKGIDKGMIKALIAKKQFPIAQMSDEQFETELAEKAPKFKVYQFHLSRELGNLVNAEGWEDAIKAHPEVAIHRDVKFSGSENFQEWMLEHFTHTADIAEAVDLDDVFAIGNLPCRHSEMKVLGDMHSISVGDIIQTADGYLWMVEPAGFECVGTGKIAEAA